MGAAKRGLLSRAGPLPTGEGRPWMPFGGNSPCERHQFVYFYRVRTIEKA